MKSSRVVKEAGTPVASFAPQSVERSRIVKRTMAMASLIKVVIAASMKTLRARGILVAPNRTHVGDRPLEVPASMTPDRARVKRRAVLLRGAFLKSVCHAVRVLHSFSGVPVMWMGHGSRRFLVSMFA